MKKCAFILLYFGSFNNYFELFLKSCAYNEDFDWLIFTDDDKNYNYPPNVHIFYMTFKEIKEYIQSKFDFQISLKYPYKLCDYKVAYGYIFSDYLTNYNSWGFCDCDLIFGKLNHFVTDEMLDKFDRIFTVGHLSIFKNNIENNITFKKKYKECDYYEIVFSNSKNYAFDELALNEIYENGNYNVYYNDLSANISVYHYRFCLIKRIYEIKKYITESYTTSVFVWHNGLLKRYFYGEDDGVFRKIEFPYIHLQQRKMRLCKGVLENNVYQIMPNVFYPIISEYATEIEVNFNKLKKISFDIKGYALCIKNNIRWKIKRVLGNIFPGKFTRGGF